MSGSHIFADRVPDTDAPFVRLLREAGGIMLGKTTTPEFGWKAIGDSPLTGITRNPWNPAMTTGRSSAGAGAAAAAGLGPLHQGSSYYVTHEPAMDALAPVVARLAGK